MSLTQFVVEPDNPSILEINHVSEVKRLSGAKQPGRPAYTDSDKNRFYGDIWLLDQVADKTGLRSDLMRVFENNEEVETARPCIRPTSSS